MLRKKKKVAKKEIIAKPTPGKNVFVHKLGVPEIKEYGK